MKLVSSRLGEMEIQEESLLYFSKGIPGFEEETQFALLSLESNRPFEFLQAIANPDLMFIVVDPFQFLPQYEFELPDATAAELSVSEANVMIRSIVSIPGELKHATLNLAAPLVINKETRAAKQVVLGSTTYSTRQPLFQKVEQR
ncbi:flagellar assembly protein FliW [Paenibacillus sp. GCM10027626]|uniref:flagellar assembly protein FliW n=1 Tax=Paenibacillus sp. GCM10027626 TaxID=3273411 RepID=UPI003630BF10